MRASVNAGLEATSPENGRSEASSRAVLETNLSAHWQRRECAMRRQWRRLAMKAVLFVDDHEVLARLSCQILEMQGYRAVSAYNAADALEKFDQENFDILV